MGQLRNDLNAFKEQQRELNQSFIERLNSLEVRNQKSTIRSNENTESITTIVQIRNILEKLISFDDRIKRIEELNPVQNQVNILLNINPCTSKSSEPTTPFNPEVPTSDEGWLLNPNEYLTFLN